MKNTTATYTDEPIKIGKIVQNLFPTEVEFQLRQTLPDQDVHTDQIEQVNLTLNPQLVAQLKREATEQNISIASLLEQFIRQGLHQKGYTSTL